MFSPFRALLARPGAWPLAAACTLGWFCAIGTSLALVLAVHKSTGSFALAGAAVATQAVAAAVLAPLRGRLVDRRGAAGLLTLAAGEAVGGALVVWGCASDAHTLVLIATALLGACALPLIAAARGLWPTVAGPKLAQTAHAFNAALSDCAQLAAPTLVAGISLAVSPLGAFATLVGSAVVAALLLAHFGLPRHRPVARSGLDLTGVLRHNPGLQTIVVGDLAMGAWTAGTEITVIAIAAQQGHAALGALVLATLALGSIVMSLLAGTGRLLTDPGSRYVVGAALSSVGLLGFLFAGALPVVAAALIVTGAGLGLQNVAVYEALDHVSPPGRSTEAFTWLTTASAGGGALGALLGGRLVGHSTGTARLVVLAIATAGGFIVAARRRALNRTNHENSPTT